MSPECAPELIGAEVFSERRRVGERVDGFGVVAGRRAQRLRDVAEHGVGVDQDGRAAACERRGEVGRHERDTHTAAAAVHRDHRASPLRLARPPYGGRRGPQQVIAFLRPQEVARRARLDRRSKRRHRLAGVQRQHHAGRLGAVEHRRLGDDRIRLELPNGLRELTVVARGRHDASPSAPIEEVHDLLGHLRRLERQDDPRHLIHGILHAVAGEV